MFERGKSEKLIKEKGGLPWKRKKKMTCAEASKHFETIKWGQNLVKKSLFTRIKKHVRRCSVCRGKIDRFVL